MDGDYTVTVRSPSVSDSNACPTRLYPSTLHFGKTFHRWVYQLPLDRLGELDGFDVVEVIFQFARTCFVSNV